MNKNIHLGVIGIDHGHIFDMLDEMLKEGCTCDYFWTEGNSLTLNEFNKKLDGKIQTNISAIKNYCKAEEYHQKYIEKNR